MFILSLEIRPGPEVFHAQLGMKFQLPIKLKYWQIKMFLALSLSDDVFIALINVKMPTIGWHFNIYEQDKFRAQMS